MNTVYLNENDVVTFNMVDIEGDLVTIEILGEDEIQITPTGEYILFDYNCFLVMNKAIKKSKELYQHFEEYEMEIDQNID